jgi:indoleamine 2,3-dioxygenase
MLGPLNISLEEFGVSAGNGFLPDQLPLRRLPDPYYDSWEIIVAQVPSLLKLNRLRYEVDALPVLSTSKLGAENEWQRAYLLLSFMTHGYIWGGKKPSEVRFSLNISQHPCANRSIEITSSDFSPIS